MIKDIEGLIEKLEEIAPVFGTDIRKDEIEEHKNFFIYNARGEINKANTSTKQYTKKFYLHFVTKDRTEIDEIKIINMCSRPHGLTFERTEVDVGKFDKQDIEATMTTFIFNQILEVCNG